MRMDIVSGFSICLICCGLFMFGCKSTAGHTAPVKHIVEIKAMKFQPAELSLKKGDTVMWVNRDIVAHDVTEELSKAWTSSAMASGGSWSLVVDKSAEYFCSIHVVMKGRLLVK